MQKRLDYYYKSYDIEECDSVERKCLDVMNEYGYNYELNNKRIIDYDKKCSRVLYSDVKMQNNKGKR